MAFTYTPTVPNNSDPVSKRIAVGTYTSSGGGTGGAITTGLNKVEFFGTDNGTQSATTNQVSISGGTVTLTTVANESGRWFAIGY